MTTNNNKTGPGKGNQETQKNWRKYLKILHISAIGLLIVLFGLLTSFALKTPTPPKSESPGKDSSDTKPAFFESGAVYYVRSTLEDKMREHIVGLLKTLKMNKKSIKSDLGLDLNKISKNREADPQYFFYKGSEDTIYTFIKSQKKKKLSSERIKISILEGNNPANKPWGIYQLEKKLMEDSTDEFVYILEHKEDKYGKRIGKLTDDDLKGIVENFAGVIQGTINKNPQDTQKSGENLDFRFTLSRKDEKNQYVKVELNDKDKEKIIFPLKAIKRLRKLTNPLPNQTHEEFDTFEIDEDRKRSLENELIIAFNNLFSSKDEEIFESQLKIYKNDEDISTSTGSNGYSFGKLKALLGNEEYKYNSFIGWESIFKSFLKEVNFKDFIKYINTRQKQLNKIEDDENKVKGQGLSREIINTIIAIIVVLFIYATLWFYFRLQLKQEPKEKGAGKPGERSVAKRVTTPVTKVEIPAKDLAAAGEIFQLNETQRLILQEIRNSLEKAKSKAVDPTYTLDKKLKPGALELKNKIDVVLNLVNEIVKKDFRHETFKLKLDQAKDTLKEFRKLNKITEIDPDLEKIEKELDVFEIIPGEPEEQEKKKKKKEPKKVKETIQKEGKAIPESITKEITNINEILNKIDKKKYLGKILGLFGLNKLFYRRLKKLDKKYKAAVEAIKKSPPYKEKREFDPNQYLVDFLKAPIENKQSLKDINSAISSIVRDSQLEEKLKIILEFIREEMKLNTYEENVLEIIDKVRREKDISKKYRLCAVNLHDDLFNLEEKYQNEWFWELLADELLLNLKEDINLFRLKNLEAKSIYERHLEKEILIRNIEQKDIKKVIEQHHWVQVWDILIRMSDFFNVYFDDERADIKFVLGYYSQKIKELLKELGYEIKHIKHLSLIPNDYRKQHDIEPIEKSKIERNIIQNLVEENNKRFLKAVENIPPGYERVIFVDRLGLVDKFPEKSMNISNLRFGAYTQTILKSYISSGSGKKEQDTGKFKKQKSDSGLFDDLFEDGEGQDKR